MRAMTPQMTDLCSALLSWFEQNQRVLPWRTDPSAYRVWVSEIMLQQTQVATVVPYFERWMQRFPDVETLAEAPIEDVLAQWSGLGYYRRAHLLHLRLRVLATLHPEGVPYVRLEVV